MNIDRDTACQSLVITFFGSLSLKNCGVFQLLMPADEKLEEFWIDFNLGSSSISFYFSLSNKKGQVPLNAIANYCIQLIFLYTITICVTFVTTLH